MLKGRYAEIIGEAYTTKKLWSTDFALAEESTHVLWLQEIIMD